MLELTKVRKLAFAPTTLPDGSEQILVDLVEVHGGREVQPAPLAAEGQQVVEQRLCRDLVEVVTAQFRRHAGELLALCFAVGLPPSIALVARQLGVRFPVAL